MPIEQTALSVVSRQEEPLTFLNPSVSLMINQAVHVLACCKQVQRFTDKNRGKLLEMELFSDNKLT